MRFISDVHGKYNHYLKIIKKCEKSIQLGDMGFDYTPIKGKDHTKHQFIRGNHDNWDIPLTGDPTIGLLPAIHQTTIENKTILYISGAYSIDWQYRVLEYYKNMYHNPLKTWYENEELPQEELLKAINIAITNKPDIIISHDCPLSVGKIISNEEILQQFGLNSKTFFSRTQLALQFLFAQYQPKLWVFGHYHTTVDKIIDNTRFICMPELAYIDIDLSTI
jgi:predicted phosphodiesterase